MTDRHTMTAQTALAQHHAVKTFGIPELTIASLLLDAGMTSSPDDAVSTSSSSLSAIVGGISISDGSEGALRRVRLVVMESAASEAGVLEMPEMLTSDA